MAAKKKKMAVNCMIGKSCRMLEEKSSHCWELRSHFSSLVNQLVEQKNQIHFASEQRFRGGKTYAACRGRGGLLRRVLIIQEESSCRARREVGGRDALADSAPLFWYVPQY